MNQIKKSAISRRAALQGFSAGGLALILGIGRGRAEVANVSIAAKIDFDPNAYLQIAQDGTVTAIVAACEMGQGIYTTLAMAIADELDADWKRVVVEPAPVDESKYGNAFFGGAQLTAASASVIVFENMMRKAGASARSMLIKAAAQKWKVEPVKLTTANSEVSGPDGQKISYGDLVEVASGFTVPKSEKVTLKTSKDFTLLGRSIPRMENPDIVRGKLVYGIDIKLPGMLTASVAHCPVAGGTVKSCDMDAAKNSPGVRGVYQIPSGIAVVGDHYWAARTGRDLLKVEWNDGDRANLSSTQLEKDYLSLSRATGTQAVKTGDPAGTIAASKDAISADYIMPYIAHSPMEPLNCTMHEHDGICDVFVGTQYQSLDRTVTASVLGIPEDHVNINTVHMGGGFGRRGNPKVDVVAETAQIMKAARELKAPIRNLWTREDDVGGGWYRPAIVSHNEASLDKDNMPAAWLQRLVSQSIMAPTEFPTLFIQNGVNSTMIAAAGTDIAYTLPQHLLEVHVPTEGATVQWLRSVGNSATAFTVESFVDELAHKAGVDPIEYRRKLLDPSNPRLVNVLNVASEKSGWGGPKPAGMGRGVAVQDYWGTKIANVIEITATDGSIKVDRVVVVIDCGRVLNPDMVLANMEGCVVFALSAALYGQITLQDGKAQQTNFDTYRMLRMKSCPKIEVHIVQSNEDPGGVGEASVPHVSPALCNAIFDATGKRVRKLPVSINGFIV